MSEAMENLVELLCPVIPLDTAARQRQVSRWEEKINMLVIGWPSLAAILAELLQENGRAVPNQLRRAYQILEQEKRNG